MALARACGIAVSPVVLLLITASGGLSQPGLVLLCCLISELCPQLSPAWPWAAPVPAEGEGEGGGGTGSWIRGAGAVGRGMMESRASLEHPQPILGAEQALEDRL